MVGYAVLQFHCVFNLNLRYTQTSKVDQRQQAVATSLSTTHRRILNKIMDIKDLTIPKPVFKTCDETSLKLTWDNDSFVNALKQTEQANQYAIVLQYKEVHEQWDKAKDFAISSSGEGVTLEIVLKEADLVDLKPGTPYFVRLALVNKADKNNVILGPETVFDTKPVDCTPKKKTCCIS